MGSSKSKKIVKKEKEIDLSNLSYSLNLNKEQIISLEKEMIKIMHEKISNLEHSEISKENVEMFVKHLLTNEKINLGYVPDYFESKLYKNMFILFIEMIKESLEKVKIEVMDHEITLIIKPIQTNNSNLPQETNEKNTI